MNMYDKIDMHTLGNLPTVMEIEVPKSIPTPIPFIPNWVKVIIGVLVVGIGILIYNLVTNHYEKKKRDMNDAKKNKVNENEKAENEKALAEFRAKYKVDKAT